VKKSKVYIKFLIFLHYIGQRISVEAGVEATVRVKSPVGVGAAIGVRATVGAASFWCSSGTKYSTVKLQILYYTCQNAWYSEKKLFETVLTSRKPRYSTGAASSPEMELDKSRNQSH
jgi:hypothetical protein